MRSLTGALFRGVILGAAFVLLAAGIVLFMAVRTQLVRQLDDSLTDKVRMLALSVEEKPYGLEADLEEMRTGDMEETETPEYLWIRAAGRTIYRSAVLEGIGIPDHPASMTVPHHGWTRLPDGRMSRSVLLSFVPAVDDEEEDLQPGTGNPDVIVDTTSGPGGRVVMQLFRDASGQRSFLNLFALLLLATGIGSIGLLSLAVWVVIKREAEPVNDLASRIENMRDEDLSIRFDEETVFAELAPLVRKLNVFLDNLEESFDRERGFTSDAAHELRTPLAGLKSTIEVALERGRETSEYRKTLQTALEIVRQMESLVDSLLVLARLESGQEAPVASGVHLPVCVAEAWENYSSEADLKDLKVSLNINSGRVNAMDRSLITRVLDELFGNAVHYTEPGGSVKVDLDQGEGAVRLQVSNTGSRVGAGDAERVFDRFWRGSESRDDTGTRFGLGLSIVREMVEVMGGQVEVETELGGEFKVILTLPR